jgi:hypothetical protein
LFTPDGYFSAPSIVAWLADLGEQGRLPRHLGFVHPGDEARWDDLPAATVARHALGEKLAAGAMIAEGIVDPSGTRIAVPTHYWSSSSADKTLKDGRLDLSVLGLDNDLHIVSVILKFDAVTAALGFRLEPRDKPEATASKEDAAAEAPSTSAPLASADTAPTAREPFEYGKARAEFAARKLAWEKGGATGTCSDPKRNRNSPGAPVFGPVDPR